MSRATVCSIEVGRYADYALRSRRVEGQIVLAVLSGIAGFSVGAGAQTFPASEQARIEHDVRDVMTRTGIPSVQVAVVRGGRLAYAHSWGRASDTIPASDPLAYQIASNSKQFTAAAVLLLQRDGKLHLDDKVAQYLSGITAGDRMTIRQLLSHMSGLRDYWPQDYSYPGMERPVTPQQIADRWAKGPLDFEPGTKFAYSNTGYVVAGLIVEKVAGEPLIAFLQRRIFKPLGMTVTSQDDARGAGFPQGYSRDALGPIHTARPPARGWLYAAGELSMSASDLARWDMARLNRILLTPAEWAEQERENKLPDGKGTHYGLGVGVGVMDGHQAVAHAGESIGFLSVNATYTDGNTGVVVLTNSDFSNGAEILTQRIAATVLPPVKTATALTADETALQQARRTFDQLRTGTLARRTMTANSNAYFSPTVLANYQASLFPLGTPTAFEASQNPEEIGGFVRREYRISYPNRTLTITALIKQDSTGRMPISYEQFIVSQSVG